MKKTVKRKAAKPARRPPAHRPPKRETLIHGQPLIVEEDPSRFTVVGHPVEKVDGRALATGQPVFTDDFTLPRLLEAKFVFSPHAHARIKSIDTREAEAMPGVVAILHAFNTPSVRHTTAGQSHPEPSPQDTVMFDRKARFIGDRVALVAAETVAEAAAAVGKIKVEYEKLATVFSPEAARAEGAPVLHDEADAVGITEANRNLVAEVEIGFPGAAADAKAGAALLIEKSAAAAAGRFLTGAQQNCPLEPHACLTWLDETGRLVIRTTTQVPWHARRIVARVLGLPLRDLRVIKPRIGGGFGGKQEILLEYFCGAVTLRTGRPCRIVLSRSEEFVFSRTRHPFRTDMAVGADRDGRIRAISMTALVDTGNNGSHALTVMANAGAKCLPLYNKTEAVHFRAEAAYTNRPAAGAFRGYGATQGAFALESVMDEIAEKLGMDPCELRRRNHLRSGETSPVFNLLGEGGAGAPQVIRSCRLEECLDLGARAFGWSEKRRRPRDPGPRRRGVGMCALMQGSGVPRFDMAGALLRLNDDGSFQLRVGATDLGTGSDTVLAQIAAETLTVGVHDIQVLSSDTDHCPYDPGAYASSTTYVSGGAVRNAALKLRATLCRIAAEQLELPTAELAIMGGEVRHRSGRRLGFAELARRAYYLENQEAPTAHASFWSPESPPPFAAHFAEVEVDIVTGKVTVLDYVAAVDCGQVIHPRLAEGQVEGAVVCGLGFALFEEYALDRTGRVLTATLADYRIPSMRDLPPVKSLIVPSWEPTGPYGAKSVGEINVNGPAPAIANAIRHATGVRLRELPFTPERVWRALRAAAPA